MRDDWLNKHKMAYSAGNRGKGDSDMCVQLCANEERGSYDIYIATAVMVTCGLCM